ncbi:Alpha/Beta hydrolase protein [Microdochium trichocladiopsis]|uniref:Alpha/Beta hydrolase protein n=1 Tax=Microdochium trichocladiopsis TaxID=1682393 RepID=A0A9P9BLJ6_9PEZI|nr:Alpha/Beta hydrolase protein [Microdochium trichocladiopsis]KAH7024460.1 Alpha/Beta hydrolase protein [Microdochium trichocladiopsis]
MSQPAATAEVHRPELFFVEHNNTSLATETIVFLHGAFGSHHEWDHVVSHLSAASDKGGVDQAQQGQYHILVPDQLQHGRSRQLAATAAESSAAAPPFTSASAADAVAALIRKHARPGPGGGAGRAHVVGLSLGGFVAQALVRRHPDVVQSLFITGATPFTPAQMWLARHSTGLHWGLWAVMGSGFYRFAAWRAGLLEHGELQRDMWENNRTADLAQGVYGDLAQWGWDDVAEVAKAVASNRIRVLVCAGGDGDNVEGTKEMVKVIRQGGTEEGGGGGDAVDCQGFVVAKAIHGWDLQFPDLFATAVRAWIHQETMPPQFVTVDS